MPECSSIIQLDYNNDTDKCKHSNIIISGGILPDGILENALVGF